MTTLAPERRGMTTASCAPLIVNGSAADLYQHWLERTGQAEPEDLSDVYEVQHGKYLEPFVLDWHQRRTLAPITERQRFIVHPTLPKIGCTLDGFREADNAVVECKVLNPFTPPAEFIAFYAPQVIVQRACRAAACGVLVVQQGNSAPKEYDIETSAEYEAAIFERLAAFQICVETNTPPGPPPPAPIPPERWRSIDLDARPCPNWGHAMMPTLNLWRDTKQTADMHEQAKRDVKVLLPDDVGRVTYGAITVKRARNGAVSIRGAD